MNTAIATSASYLPLVRTGPVSARLIWGKSKPTNVTTNVAPATMRKSENENPAAFRSRNDSIHESFSASAKAMAVRFETGRSSLLTMDEYVLRLTCAER